MEYKVGDKLLCKKDYYNNNVTKLVFTKNKYYIIRKIRKNRYDINCNIENKYVSILNDDEIYSLDLFRYFYTKQEERKLKLEKINGI